MWRIDGFTAAGAERAALILAAVNIFNASNERVVTLQEIGLQSVEDTEELTNHEARLTPEPVYFEEQLLICPGTFF